ncbi:MAG TPA: hypothetical protein VIN59_00685, partial [Alphaproteobacteria bacterium]
MYTEPVQTVPAPATFTQGQVSDLFHTAVGDCSARTVETEAEMKAFLQMHHDRYWALPMAQKHFYKRVSYVKLKKDMLAGHKIMALFGPKPEMPLLAGARMTFPELLGLKGGQRQGLPDHPFDADGFSADEWLHIQTLTANLKTNGSGGVYTGAVFSAMEEFAKAQGRTLLSGKMAWGNADDKQNNHASYNAFKRNGFGQFGP